MAAEWLLERRISVTCQSAFCRSNAGRGYILMIFPVIWLIGNQISPQVCPTWDLELARKISQSFDNMVLKRNADNLCFYLYLELTDINILGAWVEMSANDHRCTFMAPCMGHNDTKSASFAVFFELKTLLKKYT